jgi:hypothetical protein
MEVSKLEKQQETVADESPVTITAALHCLFHEPSAST